MFLDENGVPFTGGTYFPPKEIQGRPDFKKVLNNVHNVYNENREKILAQAPQVKEIFLKINQRSAVLNQPLLPFVDKIISYLDEEHGSFKGAPKFPQFYLFDAMFYFYLKTNDEKYLKPVETLLKNICSKGIYDQLAGGIARYTVDDKWIIPHFEKMLYDNIQFISLLSKFYQSTKSDYFKSKLIQTINYINREFVNDIGLYGSAYDADSEGVEGKFYTWSFDELSKILQTNLNIFAKKYLVTNEGNFEGKNILVEQNNDLDEKEQEIIERTEKDLILTRNKRVKPLFDDKSQTDQNAFLITALLNASVVLEDENIKEIAFQKFKINPDIITMAKGMGNGFPIGGILVNPKIKATHGLLGTTFGGNHLACRASLAVLDIIKKDNLQEKTKSLEKYFKNKASSIKKIKKIKGRGLMLGLEFDFEVSSLRKKLIYDYKIFTGGSSNKNLIRILPPLTIQEKHFEYFFKSLEREMEKNYN